MRALARLASNVSSEAEDSTDRHCRLTSAKRTYSWGTKGTWPPVPIGPIGCWFWRKGSNEVAMAKNGSRNAPMYCRFLDTIVDSVVLVDPLQLSVSEILSPAFETTRTTELHH